MEAVLRDAAAPSACRAQLKQFEPGRRHQRLASGRGRRLGHPRQRLRQTRPASPSRACRASTAAPPRRRRPATPTTGFVFPEITALLDQASAETDADTPERPAQARPRRRSGTRGRPCGPSTPNNVARQAQARPGPRLGATQLLRPRRPSGWRADHGAATSSSGSARRPDRLPDRADGVRPAPDGARRPRGQLRRPQRQLRAARGDPRSSSGSTSRSSGQYLVFLQHLFPGDLGTSLLLPGPRLDVVLERLPVHDHPRRRGDPAHRRRRHPARACGWPAAPTPAASSAPTSRTIAGQSMPDFWIGFMLLILFAVLIPMLPASGFTTWSGAGPADGDRSRSCRSR